MDAIVEELTVTMSMSIIKVLLKLVYLMAELMVDHRLHHLRVYKLLLLWTRKSMGESVAANDGMDGEEN